MGWETIATSVLGSLASKVVSSVLSDEQPAQQQAAALPAPTELPTPPKVETPVAMPTPSDTDEKRRNAQRMSIAQQLRRRGRQSTILTDSALQADATLGA